MIALDRNLVQESQHARTMIAPEGPRVRVRVRVRARVRARVRDEA